MTEFCRTHLPLRSREELLTRRECLAGRSKLGPGLADELRRINERLQELGPAPPTGDKPAE